MFDNGMDIDRVDWIRDGTINALAYPRAAAAEFGVAGRRARRQPADDRRHDSLADMVAGTERGLLLTTLWYIRVVDPAVLLLTGLTRDGVYLVEDGAGDRRRSTTSGSTRARWTCCAGSPRPAPARSRCRANGATGPPGRRCRRCGSPTSTCRRSARRNNATMHDPLNGELGRFVALAPPELRPNQRAGATDLRQDAVAAAAARRSRGRRACRRGGVGRRRVRRTVQRRRVIRSATTCGARFTSRSGGSAFPARGADVRRRLPAEGAGRPRGARPAGAVDGRGRLGSRQRSWATLLFNAFLPGVARLRELDPVTTEIVRLRGATQHNCRLCKSLREGHALDAGGSESLYDADRALRDVGRADRPRTRQRCGTSTR